MKNHTATRIPAKAAWFFFFFSLFAPPGVAISYVLGLVTLTPTFESQKGRSCWTLAFIGNPTVKEAAKDLCWHFALLHCDRSFEQRKWKQLNKWTWRSPAILRDKRKTVNPTYWKVDICMVTYTQSGNSDNRKKLSQLTFNLPSIRTRRVPGQRTL